MKQMRQGDLFFEQINALPEGLKETKDNVLAYGEVTGHKHQVVTKERDTLGEQFRILEDNQGRKYIEFYTNGQVVHEEHATLSFLKGTIYRVTPQKEYDPQIEAQFRRIID